MNPKEEKKKAMKEIDMANDKTVINLRPSSQGLFLISVPHFPQNHLYRG
jgi:hypothetical protein